MAGWVDSYHYGGYTYNRGDALVLNGSYYYDITDTSPNGALSNATRYFYGVYVLDDGSLPLNPVGIMNWDYNNSPTLGTIRFDAIASGGTPDTHTVKYNANGGSGAPSSQTKVYGTILTLSSTKPARTGYTFQGWGTSADDTTVDYAAGGQYGLDKDITLYAIWKANSYYIKYNANGGSGTMTNSTCEYDTAETLKANAFSKTGYSFANWNTKANGTGTSYANKASVKNLTSTNGGTVNLYAQWEINQHDLTVNPNGGVWNDNTTTRTYTQDYASTKSIPDPERTGYTFDGWTLDGYGDIENGIYTFGAGNATLTAKWTRIVLEVTFDSATNGGSPDSTKDVYYGDAVGTLPTPTKPYYKFVGWFTKPEGGTQVSATQVITSSVTYYAQFKIDASVSVDEGNSKWPAIVWQKENGVWHKYVVWEKRDGIWGKSTGSS